MFIQKTWSKLLNSAVILSAFLVLSCASQHYEGPSRPDSETFTLRVNTLNTPIVDGRPVTAKISGNGYNVKLLPGRHSIDFNPTVSAYPYVAEIGKANLRFEGKSGQFYYTKAERITRESAVVRLVNRNTKEVVAEASVDTVGQ